FDETNLSRFRRRSVPVDADAAIALESQVSADILRADHVIAAIAGDRDGGAGGIKSSTDVHIAIARHAHGRSSSAILKKADALINPRRHRSDRQRSLSIQADSVRLVRWGVVDHDTIANKRSLSRTREYTSLHVIDAGLKSDTPRPRNLNASVVESRANRHGL